MHIKPIATLTADEVIDLAAHAAERGERIEDVNPFPEGTVRHDVFVHAHAMRALELKTAVA